MASGDETSIHVFPTDSSWDGQGSHIEEGERVQSWQNPSSHVQDLEILPLDL
jgi:hypothetical protein